MNTEDGVKVDSSGLTQDMLNNAMVDFKKCWDKLLLDSGLSQTKFIAKGGVATQALAEYQASKEHIESEGVLEMPEFLAGITIKLD